MNLTRHVPHLLVMLFWLLVAIILVLAAAAIVHHFGGFGLNFHLGYFEFTLGVS